MAHIKAYKPNTNSIVSGQVLKSPYPNDKAKIIVREMAELLVMDLVEKGLATINWSSMLDMILII